jgi:ABC-type iron transport system FetAB ATPase subunit
MGPSGGGKTTLMKIMLGLFEPTRGEVLIDGVSLSTIGPKAYREQVAAVMQEDQLLSGSIADDICFFDTTFDEERMVRGAQAAAIHEEIMAMPMAYNSLIGDMGSSLSGGQKKRVLLARALYRQPKILFMDEGTAHLDVEERQVNESLRHLNITRISIAHRSENMDGVDEVFCIEPAAKAVGRASPRKPLGGASPPPGAIDNGRIWRDAMPFALVGSVLVDLWRLGAIGALRGLSSSPPDPLHLGLSERDERQPPSRLSGSGRGPRTERPRYDGGTSGPRRRQHAAVITLCRNL